MSVLRAVTVGVVVTVLALTLAGCTQGPPVGSLEGKLTLKGQPFSNARVNLINQKTGKALAAELAPDGSFRVENAEVGTYVVFLAPKTVGDPDNPAAGSGQDPNVPPECYDQGASKLRVEIKPGPNTATIELAP
ncbi:MAG: hypothetical protein RMJ16_10275 [Thermoguttaceae bacterium]|nr:hypothetical protein [Thermoguttaceae bacterium]